MRASVELPIHKDLRILELLSRIGGLEAKGADFSNVTIRRTGADGRGSVTVRWPDNLTTWRATARG